LLIEYAVEKSFGNAVELEQRHALESRMDQTLGWTGLGACDGGSSGSATMEACCYVVDFESICVLSHFVPIGDFENERPSFPCTAQPAEIAQQRTKNNTSDGSAGRPQLKVRCEADKRGEIQKEEQVTLGVRSNMLR
jgi:hypothetical protein